jgi:hypothetical protein
VKHYLRKKEKNPKSQRTRGLAQVVESLLGSMKPSVQSPVLKEEGGGRGGRGENLHLVESANEIIDLSQSLAPINLMINPKPENSAQPFLDS